MMNLPFRRLCASALQSILSPHAVPRMTCVSHWAADTSCSSYSHLLQRRTHWQMVLQLYKDPNTGEEKITTWDMVLRGTKNRVDDRYEAVKRSAGMTLLERHLSQPRHIKPTDRRHQAISRKEHDRSVKKVQDLTQYIHFMKQTTSPDDK